MHHLTDRIAHTAASVTPVVKQDKTDVKKISKYFNVDI